MRYPAAEKLEIIRLVEQSHLPVRRTLAKISIPPTTFYRWYDRFVEHGPEGLEDRPSSPSRVWNRIPEAVRDRILNMALEEPDLSPRELAVRFTDTEKYFVSEASVYRLLKSHDLITSPAYIVIKAADEFKDKTTAPNQMWQTDFTYLKVIGWGWFYLSTILDDYSRYIIGWKLCGTMRAEDVTATLDIALAASGCDSAKVLHKPRLLSDNGLSYIAEDLAKYLEDKGMKHVRGAPMHPQTQGKIERWHQTLKNRVLLENNKVNILEVCESMVLVGLLSRFGPGKGRPCKRMVRIDPGWLVRPSGDTAPRGTQSSRHPHPTQPPSLLASRHTFA